MAKQLLPRALTTLIDELGNLSGVGVRTAERYAYHLLHTKAESNKRLSNSIANLKANVKYCPATFALIDSDEEISPLYADPTRNKKVIAVVEEPLDIIALERTGQYNGTYHVLGGVISPIDNIGPEQLHWASPNSYRSFSTSECWSHPSSRDSKRSLLCRRRWAPLPGLPAAARSPSIPCPSPS